MADEDPVADYMADDLSLFVGEDPALQGRSLSNATATTSKPKNDWKGFSGPSHSKKPWLHKREEKKEKKAAIAKEEDDRRTAGLEAAIPASNIGFKLLEKMGYRQGQAIGREGQGIVEPVGMQLKRTREGLGREAQAREEAARKKARAEEERRKREHEQGDLMAAFKESARRKWEVKKLHADVAKCRSALRQLEEEAAEARGEVAGGEGKGGRKEREGGEVEEEGWEGKRRKVAEEEEEEKEQEEGEEEEEEITTELLHVLRQHLRDVYHYCLYCGFKYDSKAALEGECPGEDEDDH